MRRWYCNLGGWASLIMIQGCTGYFSPLPVNLDQSPDMNQPIETTAIWQGEFYETDWLSSWQVRQEGAWGLENLEVMTASSGPHRNSLRVFYPAGSASPSVSRREGVPLGGAQFYADLNLDARTALRLSYAVRFPEDFDFVKGGKLPGLFGGVGNSGGNIPDGTDGFSTRFMWRRQGEGEVYAYLPTSETFGTSIGRGAWSFQPGVWHRLEQEVILNHPNRSDGHIRVWVDGRQVIDQGGLTFRTVEELKIDGVFFSTFFGGGDPSWATPRNVYVDFADFAVYPVNSREARMLPMVSRLITEHPP